jgi:transcriptional regulator with XRE-family HTH domain
MIADWLDPTRMDEASRKILEQEGLIFHVTECVAEAMQEKGITKAELAARLGRSRAYVTQLLNGTANMTLKTIADVFTAMDLELTVGFQPAIWVKPDQRRRTARPAQGREPFVKISARKPAPTASGAARRKPREKTRK